MRSVLLITCSGLIVFGMKVLIMNVKVYKMLRGTMCKGVSISVVYIVIHNVLWHFCRVE